jgi:hypothetical protein
MRLTGCYNKVVQATYPTKGENVVPRAKRIGIVQEKGPEAGNPEQNEDFVLAERGKLNELIQI